jgi:hypothetical protein
MNWKGCGRKPSWPNLTYYSRPCLEGLRKTTKNFRQDRRCPDQHSNPRHSEYEGGNHSTITCDERMDESRFAKRQKIGEDGRTNSDLNRGVRKKQWDQYLWLMIIRNYADSIVKYGRSAYVIWIYPHLRLVSFRCLFSSDNTVIHYNGCYVGRML